MVSTLEQLGENSSERSPISTFLDPSLLRAARLLYRTYSEIHSESPFRPIGVAIHRYTYKGHLIFISRKPILLPQECFIPFDRIESEIY